MGNWIGTRLDWTGMIRSLIYTPFPHWHSHPLHSILFWLLCKLSEVVRKRLETLLLARSRIIYAKFRFNFLLDMYHEPEDLFEGENGFYYFTQKKSLLSLISDKHWVGSHVYPNPTTWLSGKLGDKWSLIFLVVIINTKTHWPDIIINSNMVIWVKALFQFQLV